MPGLLDLPPELIEQIHLAHERLVEADHENDIGVAEELGRSRLTCRYFERATRRAFAGAYFAAWTVKAPDDENIRKFCAMASTPGLAAAIQQLVLLVDDDYTMVVGKADFPESLETQDVATFLQDRGVQLDKKRSTKAAYSTFSKKKVTHAFDNTTGAFVPAAYLRHRVALIAALRECKNVTNLWIRNTPFDSEHVHRYKRSSEWNGIGPPPQDGGVFFGELEGEDDGTNASEEQEEPMNDKDGEIGDGSERKDGGYDEGNGDAEDRDQGSGSHAEGHDYNAAEGTEIHDENAHDYRDILFDITLSYNYALHLAAEAGMRPTKISPFRRHSKIAGAPLRIGLTDCAGLVQSKATLERLTALKLGFVLDQRIPYGNPFEKIGLRLGKQVSEALLHMPVLRSMSVSFQSVNSVSAWSILAKGPAIPTLNELWLNQCMMNMNDFKTFVVKHCSTWTLLSIVHMHLCNGTKEELGDLYARLSRAPSIEVYRQRSLYFGVEHEEHLGMPGEVSYPILDDGEDEDGFVTVYQTDRIRWKGHGEVTRVLGVLAEHMRS